MTGIGRLKWVCSHFRHLPLAGIVVTRLVRATRPFWAWLSRFDRRADEIHLLTAALRDLSAEVDRLGREIATLRALRDLPDEVSGAVQATLQAAPVPVAVAILARTGAGQVEEITFDVHETDHSDLMARLAACPPAGLAAATIPLSGRETPEALRDLAGKLVRAMGGHAILCLRLLDQLSLFLVGPRTRSADNSALQVSPELVRDIFEHQGCRLVGLRRGTAGPLPTLDLILEMREP